MSVSLLEVIEAGGYDLSTTEGATWLLCQKEQFEELINDAEDIISDTCSICGVYPMSAKCNNAGCDE